MNELWNSLNEPSMSLVQMFFVIVVSRFISDLIMFWWDNR